MADIGILQKWATENKLKEASLNAEGTLLTLGEDERLPADTKVTISHDGKSCEYTIASLFLQIVDPSISLPKYRLACKKHKVKDPVKASDKNTVVAFFGLAEGEGAETAPAAAAPSDTAATAKESTKEAPSTQEDEE
eukprot:scaffold1501_cov130-Cylindrotheca_fusiformis.AAC.1